MDDEFYQDQRAQRESEVQQVSTEMIKDEESTHEGFTTCGRVVELKNVSKDLTETYENVFDSSFEAVKEEICNNSSENAFEDVNIAEIKIIQQDGKLTYLKCKNVARDESVASKENSSRNSEDEGHDSAEVSKKLPNYTEFRNRIAEERRTETIKRSKYERLQNICIFCDQLVLNFARHMIRNHNEEFEVQKLLSYPKQSLERKRILTALRKKGNFVLNAKKCIRPMRMRMHSLYEDYLPCTNCLGFYARKQLRKHKASCTQNQETFTPRTQSALIKLKNDKLSMTAKNDMLISAYGSQILNARKDRQFYNHVTRKMKQLVKLLETVKALDPEIENLTSALKPKHYNTLVAATKQCVNKHTDKRINNPTYVANIGVALRQCCYIVRRGKLKPRSRMKGSEVKELKALMDGIKRNWLNDVTSRAENNLVPKKRNDITIVTLARDIKLLIEHLKRTAQKALARLKQTKYNAAAFVDLTETIYCRMLLLNRIRPDILESLPLDNYKIEDCQKFIDNETLSERVLKESLKQLVISDHGRPFRVLLPSDVLEHIEQMINLRKTHTEKGNPYLLAMPGCMTPIYGCKVMQRHAKLCKANPKAIRSNMLQTNRATLTQIFNMSKRDVQQLAKLMGQTLSFDKLHNIYEAAKVSKLLILMAEGKANGYKGMSLEEIDLNLNKKLIGNDSDTKKYDSTEDVRETQVENDPDSENCRSKRKNIRDDSKPLDLETSLNKKKRILIPWTHQQKSVVLGYFKKHIKTRKPPKRAECDKLKEIHKDLLLNKDWLKIKVFVQNVYMKK